MSKWVVVTQDGMGLLKDAYLFDEYEKAYRFAEKHQPSWILKVKGVDK